METSDSDDSSRSRAVKVKIFIMAVDPYKHRYGYIQMSEKELTKTFIMISK